MTNFMTYAFLITTFVEDVKIDFGQNGMTAQASIDELIKNIRSSYQYLDTSKMLQNVLVHIVADPDNAQLTIELMRTFPDFFS